MDKVDPRYVQTLIEALTSVEGAKISEFEYDAPGGVRIRFKFKEDPPPAPVVDPISTPVVGFDAKSKDDEENDDPGAMHARLMNKIKLPGLGD